MSGKIPIEVNSAPLGGYLIIVCVGIKEKDDDVFGSSDIEKDRKKRKYTYFPN